MIPEIIRTDEKSKGGEEKYPEKVNQGISALIEGIHPDN
jgi:hypothetical protein